MTMNDTSKYGRRLHYRDVSALVKFIEEHLRDEKDDKIHLEDLTSEELHAYERLLEIKLAQEAFKRWQVVRDTKESNNKEDNKTI